MLNSVQATVEVHINYVSIFFALLADDICANATCPFNGICQPSVDGKRVECNCNIICAAVYRPVCGTDGETHGNECAMRSRACQKQKEIKKDYDGECSKSY